jgi:hypothetical protein
VVRRVWIDGHADLAVPRNFAAAGEFAAAVTLDGYAQSQPFFG